MFWSEVFSGIKSSLFFASKNLLSKVFSNLCHLAPTNSICINFTVCRCRISLCSPNPGAEFHFAPQIQVPNLILLPESRCRISFCSPNPGAKFHFASRIQVLNFILLRKSRCQISFGF